MKFTAQLDVDVVALESDDEITCLLTLEAPPAPQVADAPGENLIVVVDRSGSMTGAPLESVQSALHSLANRMKQQDTLGVVAFDSRAHIVVPARPMSEHHLPTVHQLIDQIHPGGSTDLSAGYLLGLREARRVVNHTGCSVMLLSDGHANQGMRDLATLGQLAITASSDQITSTTIGIGSGYDETLLEAIASGGGGSHRFAFTADDARAVVAEEAGDLLNKSLINAFVRIKPSNPEHLERIGLLHDVRRWVEAGSDGQSVLSIPLGDFYAGEQRELLVQFALPAIAAMGEATVAEFTIDYVTLPDLTAESITWPMSVNVVSAGDASKRQHNPTVVTAQLIAQTQQIKKHASDALQHGDGASAARMMEAEAGRLRSRAAAIPAHHPEAAALRTRLSQEERQLHKLAEGARTRESRLARKSLMEDTSSAIRGRTDGYRQARRRERREW